MIFGKYHIVIFKERSSGSRSLKMRGWLGAFFFLTFVGLLCSNIWLWTRYKESRVLESRLAVAESKQDDGIGQLGQMAKDLLVVQNDLMRIQAFDTKLRLMMDMGSSEGENIDGVSTETLTLGHLPLYRQEMASRRIRAFLQNLNEAVRLEEANQQELLLAVRKNRERLAVIPSIWPSQGIVTSPFGYRKSPFTGQLQLHKGIDISAKIGTPIYAPARGEVIFAGTDGAYGVCVQIKHGGGINTKYGHMQKFIVKSGQVVERGELIGYVGRTGRVTGPHLHYEVLLNGVPTDPFAYILN